MIKNDIKSFPSSVSWTFAKSMPDIPHEYIVTDHYPEKADEIAAFIAEIDKKGYTKAFYGKEYKYLEIGKYKYWVMGNMDQNTDRGNFSEKIIINRAEIEE